VAETSSRTLVCSVLFAELAGYPQLPGSEQLQRKRMPKAQIAQELVQVPMAERVVQDLSGQTAIVGEGVNDARGREHELFEVRIAGPAAPAPATRDAASVFDAGPHLIVSAYDRAVVQQALDGLAAKGARVVSPITRVGDKWMASCDHPDVRASECKVEKLGLTSIVTGPTRQAVATKVEELVERGARLSGEIEQDGGVWTAVCDSGGAGG
jgi:hypothetical protein